MTRSRIFLGLSLLWGVFFFTVGYQNAPSIPLDLSAGDAATLSAYHSVLWKYRVFWGALALLPLSLFILINVFFKRS